MKVQDIVEASDLSRNTQSTALNRALRQAYAQFPTAKNDTEAFASWAMSKQSAADELIGRQAELNRRQDAVIKSLDADNADQEQKLQALDQENDELAAELGQIEKRLDLPKKRDAEVAPATPQPEPAKAKDIPAGATAIPTPFAAPAAEPAAEPAVKTDKSKAGARAFGAMVPQLDRPQKSLDFNRPALPSDYTQQPTLPGIKQPALTNNPSDNILPALKRDTVPDPQGPWKNMGQPSLFSKDNITDVEPKYYADIAKNIAKDPNKLRTAMGMKENDKHKPEQPEADYGDDYQQMVLRLKKLAGMGPLKTVYDPAKRVYKNVPRAVQPGEKK